MSDHLSPIPWLDVLLILALIVLNGVLAMSELAIISSREARLKAMAKGGSRGAQCALDLAADPGRFLSTVQTGITLISIFAGAFSGASLGEPVAQRISSSACPRDRPHRRIRPGHRGHDLCVAGDRGDRAEDDCAALARTHCRDDVSSNALAVENHRAVRLAARPLQRRSSSG